jgi:hypothetical protein
VTFTSDLNGLIASLFDLLDEMHSILQGAMSTFKAPADPIFFSHHVRLTTPTIVSLVPSKMI